MGGSGKEQSRKLCAVSLVPLIQCGIKQLAWLYAKFNSASNPESINKQIVRMCSYFQFSILLHICAMP